jgi:hypothetical protein
MAFFRREPFIIKLGNMVRVIKITLEPGEDKEIVPFLRGFSVISKNCFKKVIKDEVKLRGDGTCLEIPNQAHSGGV